VGPTTISAAGPGCCQAKHSRKVSAYRTLPVFIVIPLLILSALSIILMIEAAVFVLAHLELQSLEQVLYTQTNTANIIAPSLLLALELSASSYSYPTPTYDGTSVYDIVTFPLRSFLTRSFDC